ncbi:MAG: class II aldolase/adducin family protein, partial [Candidatus Humimicrobiaceae bacterium]
MFTEATGSKEIDKLCNRIVSACKKLYNRNLITALGGNISLRTSNPDMILCSPSGMPLAEMLPADLCLIRLKSKMKYIETVELNKHGIDFDTASIDTNTQKPEYTEIYEFLSGKYNPTSEILIHSMVYNIRPDILSVIHSHPPYITAMSCTDGGIDFNLTEDKNYYIGSIGFVPFISGGSQ